MDRRGVGTVRHPAEPTAAHHLSPPETVNTAPRDPRRPRRPIRILLVEDDDGDALLVEELLAISGALVEIVRAQTLADARREKLDEIDCVLLDLDLPDAHGLAALHRLKTDRADLAVLVLTGLRRRAARHRRPSPPARRTTSSRARSTGRASRARSATPSSAGAPTRRASSSRSRACTRRRTPGSSAACCRRRWSRDPELQLTAHYRPGRRRALLGGDFYDAVQDADGTVHAVIGDVSGHGPDAAALGVCLRIAWRTLVLGGARPRRAAADAAARARPRAPLLVDVHDALHGHDRARPAQRRRSGSPAIRRRCCSPTAGSSRSSPRASEPPLGVVDDARWAAHEYALPERWSLLLYTDGLIEGRTGVGDGRLGGEGLAAMVRGELDARGTTRRGSSTRSWSAPRSSTAARCSTTSPRSWCSGTVSAAPGG